MLSNTKYDLYQKKNLLSKINDSKNKKRDQKIFSLIYNNNINFSNNDNGIFFDLNQLNDDILTKIENIINYYDNKKYNNYSDSSEII